MKFIHCADIHLDSPLVGLSAYQDAPADMLRTATREAFTRLVDEALAEAVDFMVIAGDLYDGSWKDFNTGLFFAREMGRLQRENIPVYVLLGNHDAENEMTRKLQWPDNVHLLPTRKAATFRLDALKVAIHGRSFKEAATTENLVTGYPQPVPGFLNIGVLHTALEGNAAHANYAPCSLADLDAKGYQYWALGHVHEYTVWQRPACTVVFPGNLQGRHIRETGPRGAVMVTADDDGIVSIERLLVDVLRWHELGVDVTEADDMSDVVRRVGNALDDVLESDAAGMPLAVRVVLTGATEAHGELFGLEAQLRQEVLALAVARGADRLWVEKVRVATSPPRRAADPAASGDALADLHELLSQAADDSELSAALQSELVDMANKLPLEVRQAVPMLDAVQRGELTALIAEASAGLIAQLASEANTR